MAGPDRKTATLRPSVVQLIIVSIKTNKRELSPLPSPWVFQVQPLLQTTSTRPAPVCSACTGKINVSCSLG